MRHTRLSNIMPMVRNLGLFFGVILLVVFATAAGQYPDRQTPYVPALSSAYYYDKGKETIQNIAGRVDNSALKAILKTELPVLSIADSGETGGVRVSYLLKYLLNLLAGVKLEEPLTYLRAEIPMMNVTPVTADNYDEIIVDEITEQPGSVTNDSPVEQTPVENRIKSEMPLIAFYNTHTSETFELTDGLTHLKGKTGGVTIVSKEIQKVIQEKYKIAVVYAPNIHDMAFNKSYTESQKTVSKLLKDYPKLEMIVDIHRDGSMTREQSLTKINGQTVAKILLVVGTDARAENPKWRENLEFARKIATKMDIMYPGLSRGIAIKQGRYNQQYSTHAVLAEIGSAKNTTSEAVATGRLFADVLVSVLNDQRTDMKQN